MANPYPPTDLTAKAVIDADASKLVADCTAAGIDPVTVPLAAFEITPDSDFAARSLAPGVVRYFHFNDTSQLSKKRLGAPFGYDYNIEQASDFSGNHNLPLIDPAMFASGSGSLRMDVPSQSGQDGGGDWYGAFSPDLTATFGPATEPQQSPAGNEFYIQWAQRFSPEILNTIFLDVDGHPAGWKLCIITAADLPPGWLATYPNGKLYASCEKIELVLEKYGEHPFFQAYNECGVYEGLVQKVPGPNYWFQNAMPAHCTYTAANALRGSTAPVPGCFNLSPNIWYTFQVGVVLGPRDRVNRRFTNSTVKVWAAVKGQPSTLLIDWNPSVLGYFPLCDGEIATPEWYGRIYLLPYMWQKDKTQVHPVASVWYDELIISKQRIPDPMV